MPNISPFPYVTYILRLWPIYSSDSGWRALLENPHTGERLGFSSPKDLITFLERVGEGGARKSTDGMEDVQPEA